MKANNEEIVRLKLAPGNNAVSPDVLFPIVYCSVNPNVYPDASGVST